MNISIVSGTNVNDQMDIGCSYMIKVQNTHILGEGFCVHREMRWDKLKCVKFLLLYYDII